MIKEEILHIAKYTRSYTRTHTIDIGSLTAC